MDKLLQIKNNLVSQFKKHPSEHIALLSIIVLFGIIGGFQGAFYATLFFAVLYIIAPIK